MNLLEYIGQFAELPSKLIIGNNPQVLDVTEYDIYKVQNQLYVKNMSGVTYPASLTIVPDYWNKLGENDAEDSAYLDKYLSIGDTNQQEDEDGL